MAIEHRQDALQAGVTLHSYRIIEVLGSGAFGITYLAEHNLLNTRHVIKEYLPDSALREHESATVTPKSSSDTELFQWGLDSFFQEARFVHELSHPNIVKVSDLFEANGTAYFVMPFLDGVTLHEWTKLNPSPTQDRLLEIFVPILEGLKYIHQKNLLHRDIKPENIYITDNGNPVLIDFGAARLAIGEKSRALTQVLTPHFAPWEQYRSKGDFTPALDYYSLSACLYQAITNDMPEEAPNRLEEDPVEPLAQQNHLTQKYSKEFLAAVDKGLAVHAKDRFQDAFAFQLALMEHDVPTAERIEPPKTMAASRYEDDPETPDGIVPDGPLTTRVTSSSHVKNSEPTKKKSTLSIVLATLVILGLGGVGYWYWTQMDKDSVKNGSTTDIVASSEEQTDSPNSEENAESTGELEATNSNSSEGTQQEMVSEEQTEAPEITSTAPNDNSEPTEQELAEQQHAAEAQQDVELWNQVRNLNTVAAFTRYLDECIQCAQELQAQQNIQELEEEAARQQALVADQRLWNEASSEQSEASFQAYLNECQICNQRANARGELDRIVEEREALARDQELWRNVEQVNSEQSYLNYLENCSSCGYQSEAQSNYQRLRDQRIAMEEALEQDLREQSAWDNAVEANTLDAYQAYLESCVNCDNRQQAEESIDLLSRLGEYVTVGVGQDFSTIQEAIDAVDPGATVEVFPGEYSESVRINKSLSLSGSASINGTTITAQTSFALLIRADNVTVSNLTIRQVQGPNTVFAVSIEQGNAVLDGLDIRSMSGAAVAIRNRANPTIRNSEIHSSTQTGVFIYDGGLGLIENNRIHGHELANIEVRDEGTSPVIRNNEIFQSQYSGIYVHNGATADIANNDIRNNGIAGVYATRAQNITISANQIFDNEEEGIVFTDESTGDVQDNDVYRNQRANIAIANRANPSILSNRIYEGNSSGIFVYGGGLGNIEENEIYQHRLSNVVITTNAEPTLRNNDIHGSEQVGIFVYDDGKGRFVGNEIYGNVIANMEVKTGSFVTLSSNTLRNSEVGLYLHEGGSGEFTDNDIINNTIVGIALATDATPTFQNNRIMNNLDGVAAYSRSRGTFRGNEVRQNEERDWAIAQGANISRR